MNEKNIFSNFVVIGTDPCSLCINFSVKIFFFFLYAMIGVSSNPTHHDDNTNLLGTIILAL